MTLHPGPSCLDAAPLARLWTEPWLGSQGATLDWTPTCTLLSTYRHLQDCGRCLGPLFLLPVPGVGDFNFLSFQQSGNPALPPHSNPHRWYRPTAKARPLSLSLKLSQLGLRGLETRLLLRRVCSTFTNSLPIVGEHLRCLSDQVGVKTRCLLSRCYPQDGQKGAVLARTPRHGAKTAPGNADVTFQPVGK